ncbi:MAG: hypothetical protein OEW75_19090, partial [Cyclobacteriaceae bacterium]|nr:hypothetical protein [Cyclobacteriaceae bacterium]
MKNNISFFLILFLLPFVTMAQKKVSLKINPDPIVVEVGKTLQLNIKAVDENGNVLKDTEISYFPVELKGIQQSMIFTGGFQIDAKGLITGRQPGVFDMFITRMPDKGENFVNEKVVVKVINQEIVKLDVRVGKVYEGAVLPLEVKVLDKGGFLVANSNIKLSSSNQKVLKTDKFLNIHALQKGKSVVSVSSGNVKAEIDIEVLPNPITQLDLRASTDIARTGDVVYFKSTALDKSNKPVTDVPLMYSLSGQAHEFATGPSAQVDSDGRFVAEEPGLYTVTVISGNTMASASVEIVERNVSQKIDIKGHGRVNTKHTSDFWIWEGVDGKDYAVTGTWGADGKAYF